MLYFSHCHLKYFTVSWSTAVIPFCNQRRYCTKTCYIRTIRYDILDVVLRRCMNLSIFWNFTVLVDLN